MSDKKRNRLSLGKKAREGPNPLLRELLTSNIPQAIEVEPKKTDGIKMPTAAASAASSSKDAKDAKDVKLPGTDTPSMDMTRLSPAKSKHQSCVKEKSGVSRLFFIKKMKTLIHLSAYMLLNLDLLV
jgi:hypothetical protein